MQFPFWFAAVVTAAPATLAARRGLARRHRAGRGRCPDCGYDLRATPGLCPECGRAAAGALRQ